MLIGCYVSGPRAGLQRYSHGRSESLQFAKLDGANLRVTLPQVRSDSFYHSTRVEGRRRSCSDGLSIRHALDSEFDRSELD